MLLPKYAFSVTDAGWTSDINTTWTSIVAAGTDATYLNLLAQSAADSCQTGNFGLRDAVLYKATGTTSYCDDAYSNRSNCDPDSPSFGTGGNARNTTRDCLVVNAIAYSFCADVISAGNKADWESDLDTMTQNVLGNPPTHGTRINDTDELMGHWFGATIYDVVKDDSLDNAATLVFGKPWGGIDATGVDKSSLRNAIDFYWATFGQGGEFVEGSEYNKSTIMYTLLGVHALNDYYGTDKFPVITALYDEIADHYYQKSTPDYSQHFQWGDVQNGQVRDHGVFRAMSLYAMMAHLDGDDAAMWDLFDAISTTGCVREVYSLFYDPDATRTKKSGQTSHGVSGSQDLTNSMGMVSWHEGWGTNDTAYYGYFKPNFDADHNWSNLDSVNIWRQDEWAFNSPKFYFGNFEDAHNWKNSLLVFGGFGAFREARGQMAYESGSNYVYHSGLTSGMWNTENTDDAIPDFLDERSRQNLYRENGDGTGVLFMFDRVKGCRPDDTSCMTSYKYNSRRGKSSWTLRNKDRMEAFNLDHQVVFNSPVAPSKSGDLITWTADNGENVELYTFMDGYTYATFAISDIGNCGAVGATPGTPYWFCGAGVDVAFSEAKHQIRLRQPTAIPRTLYALLNVMSFGGTHTYTEILDNAGDEDVQGAMVETSTERIVALFNAEDDITTTFTTTHFGGDTGYKSEYDPQRFSKAEAMSHFKVGSTVDFTTDDTKDINVFILGLDHTQGWTITANGSAAGCTVTAEGVCRFTITGAAQVHTVTWTASGLTCSAQSCSACTEPECVLGNCSWNGSSCEDTPPCDSNTCQNCDETECGSEPLCTWNGAVCEITDQCPTIPSECSSQSTCEAQGWCWENNVCITVCTPPVGGVEVTVEPSKDTFIRNGSFVNTNYDTQDLNAKHTPNGDFHRSTLISFDISSVVPANSEIQSVKLELVSKGGFNNTGTVNVFPVLQSWVENEATGTVYSTGNNWQTVMALGNSDMTGNGLTGEGSLTSYGIGGSEGDGDVMIFSSTQAMIDHVQANVDGSVDFVIHQEQNHDANFVFYDSEDATVSNRPILRIIYEESQGEAQKPPNINGGRIIGLWGS